jgi:hypothetical protein
MPPVRPPGTDARRFGQLPHPRQIEPGVIVAVRDAESAKPGHRPLPGAHGQAGQIIGFAQHDGTVIDHDVHVATSAADRSV